MEKSNSISCIYNTYGIIALSIYFDKYENLLTQIDFGIINNYKLFFTKLNIIQLFVGDFVSS